SRMSLLQNLGCLFMDADLQVCMSDGYSVAFRTRKGNSKTSSILWLCGFHSDMGGTKAARLDRWAARTGHAYTRFDYFGHGASDGDFRDGTISRWLGDALTIIDQVTHGDLVLVGSSMGGWIALLAALARPARVAGMVLIAPAADFTEDLIW